MQSTSIIANIFFTFVASKILILVSWNPINWYGETYIPLRDICCSLAEGVTRYVESVALVLACWREPENLEVTPSLRASTTAVLPSDFRSYSRVRQVTLSTCPVKGNISYPITVSVLYPSSLIFLTSLASVVGLHEI